MYIRAIESNFASLSTSKNMFLKARHSANTDTDVNALSVIPVDGVSGFLHEWVLPSSFFGREPLTYG